MEVQEITYLAIDTSDPQDGTMMIIPAVWLLYKREKTVILKIQNNILLYIE